MHGNVNEWCWDYYGEYDLKNTAEPEGALEGTRHVYRGGGWNDFGKNMRSAYRAAGQEELVLFREAFECANERLLVLFRAEGGDHEDLVWAGP